LKAAQPLVGAYAIIIAGFPPTSDVSMIVALLWAASHPHSELSHASLLAEL